jgi:putative membrane-bound dehydrogenase-like protein
MRLWWIFLAAAAAHAGNFPEPSNSEQVEGAPLPAEEAARTMKLPPGFTATVFAAEPEIRNPIACAWDPRGRLWVVENYTYAERPKRFDLTLRDRVVILEDADHDGRAEKRRVFSDTLQRLTSIEFGRGGVWLMCPPQLLFVPDADGDDVPDGEPRVVLDGFTIADGGYHNLANGLNWGPDGWLYGRCGHSCPGSLGVPGTPAEQRVPIRGGIWRFHPGREVVEVLTHGTTNPWGFDWDRHGEGFFVNTVTGHLWHLIPGAHLADSNPSPNPAVYERLDTIADHWHFDRGSGWKKSIAEAADAFGGGHAHVGMMIYQADQWPAAWRDRLFTLNLHGRRANVEQLDREGSGYVGRHQPDAFFSADPFFRGIEITTGPDGSAFILDYSDTGECHESTGIHRASGRIFKISHGKPAKPDLGDLARVTAEGVERLLEHPNAWFPRQLRKLEIPGGPVDPDPSPSGSTVDRLRRLSQLYTGRQLPRARLLQLLADPDEHVRATAVRYLLDEFPLDTITGPLAHFQQCRDTALIDELIRLARRDPSPFVRLVLASSLQRIAPREREALAAALVAHAGDAGDRALPPMVWYGIIPLGDRDPLALVRVATVCQWPDTLRWIARYLAGRVGTDGGPLAALLAAAGESQREAVLHGIGEALKGWRKAPEPASWDSFAATFTRPADQQRVRQLSAVFGDARALDGLRETALDGRAAVEPRAAALRTLIDHRPADLRAICESLLETPGLGATAARGLALFDDPAIGRKLVRNWRTFGVAERAAVLETLVSRASFATSLLEEVAAGNIARADLSAFHARQIRSLNDPGLTKQLADVWGDPREAGGDRKKVIAGFKARLTKAELAKADLARGRTLYQATCAACHQLYGEGGTLGPDLTGTGRANLDYLLENTLDPGAVVSDGFRLHLVTLKDGRVLSGIVAGQSERTLTLRLSGQETTVARAEIARQEVSPLSMMPEGLLLGYQADQVRDLMAYLMHPGQVALPE